jgi:hemerythrin-like metal-binding protein
MKKVTSFPVSVSDTATPTAPHIDKEILPQVGQEFMQLEHDEILRRLKGLEALIAQLEAGKSMASQITSSIDGMLEHTRSHFLCEEDSMKRFHYLPRGSHKAEHEEFLIEMNAALDQWKTSQNLSALKLYFLVQVPAWFMQHLNSTDLVTSRFLAQQRHFTYK